MKKMNSKYAGVMIALAMFVALNFVYGLFGTVDLVYVKDGEVLCVQENVNVFTPVDDPLENMEDHVYEENKDTLFGYYGVLGLEKYVYGEDMLNFRFHLGCKVILNLYTFRWSESSNTVVLEAYE